MELRLQREFVKILSAKIYLSFINDLLDQLTLYNLGANVIDIKIACPTQADDIAVVRPSLPSLQQILTMCDSCSRNWRFNFSSSKCVILVFKSKQKGLTENVTLTLFNQILTVAHVIDSCSCFKNV